MTWMIPFEADDVGLDHLRSADVDLRARHADGSEAPSSVFADVSIDACAAVTLPLTTW